METEPIDTATTAAPSVKRKVLVIGQIPPPYHGQSVMIEAMIRQHYQSATLVFLQMDFSTSIGEVGAFRPKKLLALPRLWIGLCRARFRDGIRHLWYPPASGNWVPVLRDFLILGLARLLFRHVIFHFHADGLTDFYPRLPRPLRPLFHACYRRPTLLLKTSQGSQISESLLRPKHVRIVPNGIPDLPPTPRVPMPAESGDENSIPRILYVGSLVPSKGILDLVSAAQLLAKRRRRFVVDLVGACQDPAFDRELGEWIRQHGVSELVQRHGSLTGSAKDQVYQRASLFCFPSFYEAETFGIVLLEAMRAGLPVVATRWRGIPEIVVDGATGILVEPRQPEHLAEALDALLADPERRATMGRRGRERFLEHFTLERMTKCLDQCFAALPPS